MDEIVIVVAYYRVSTEEQSKKGFSLPEQRRECQVRAQQLAANQGAQLQLYEFEDAASGEVLDRPGLDACREFLRNSPAHYFICLDPDRFSRSLFLQLLVTDEIEQRGVQLVFVQHQYETTAEGRLFYQMRGAISEYEKAKITERTKRGRRGKLAAGGIPAYVEPWGYIWDKQAKTLQVDTEKVPWVTQVFEWFVDGWSYSDIAEKLAGLGIAPPKRGQTWYRNAVARILGNSVYAGQLVLNRGNYQGLTPLRKVPKTKRRPITPEIRPQEEWVTVQVPAIISDDLWAKAQALLANRRRLSQPGVGLLSGLCVCGMCGQNIHYANAHGRRILRCYGRYPHLKNARPEVRQAEPCSMTSRPAEELEAAVWQRVHEWLKHPDELRCEQQRQAEEEGVDPSTGQRVAALQKQLAAREDEHRRAYALAVKGLAPEGFETELRRLKTEITALQKEIEAANAQLSQLDRRNTLAPDLSALGDDVEAALNDLDLPGRQYVVRGLLHRVIVYPDHWKPIFR